MIGYFTHHDGRLLRLLPACPTSPHAMRLTAMSSGDHLKEYDKRMYRRARMGIVGIATNLPTKVGEKFTLGIYRIASKLVKFN